MPKIISVFENHDYVEHSVKLINKIVNEKHSQDPNQKITILNEGAGYGQYLERPIYLDQKKNILVTGLNPSEENDKQSDEACDKGLNMTTDQGGTLPYSESKVDDLKYTKKCTDGMLKRDQDILNEINKAIKDNPNGLIIFRVGGLHGYYLQKYLEIDQLYLSGISKDEFAIMSKAMENLYNVYPNIVQLLKTNNEFAYINKISEEQKKYNNANSNDDFKICLTEPENFAQKCWNTAKDFYNTNIKYVGQENPNIQGVSALIKDPKKIKKYEKKNYINKDNKQT